MKRFVFYLLGTFLCITYTYSQQISSKEAEVIKQRIVDMNYDFISYLPEIAAKNKSPMEECKLAQKYIEQALDLFVGNGYDYPYLDEQGELRMHKGVCVNVISEDSVQNPSRLLRVFLTRLMSMTYFKYELPSLDATELSIKLTPNMPENAMYSVVDINDKPVAYIIGRKIVETPEGEDVFYIVKLTDITLYRR